MTKNIRNLASEYLVLSILHRLGADASLIHGNKDNQIIFVENEYGTYFTIIVNSVPGQIDWTLPENEYLDRDNQFYLLISYDRNPNNPILSPSIWVLPSNKIHNFIEGERNNKIISREKIKSIGQTYFYAWHLITGQLEIIWKIFTNKDGERNQGFGHGIEFHDMNRSLDDKVVAFLDGFKWYYDNPNQVSVYCIEPDTISNKEVVDNLKEQITKIVFQKELFEGMVNNRIFAKPNC